MHILNKPNLEQKLFVYVQLQQLHGPEISYLVEFALELQKKNTVQEPEMLRNSAFQSFSTGKTRYLINTASSIGYPV